MGAGAPFHASAEGYDRHVGRYGEQLARGLVEVAGVARGQRALDVGCGTGALTTVLVERLGAGAVSAADPSEPFVAACRARAPGADVRVAPAEALPFGEREFDAVLSQLLVNLLDRPEAGLRNMRRAARPGGVVAGSVWSYAGMPLLRSFWEAAAEIAPDEALSIPEAQRVGYRGPEALGRVWAAAGLERISTGTLEAAAGYADFDDLWAPFEAGVGRSGALCAGLRPDRREALYAEVHRRVGAPSGPFELTARAWWAAGACPR